MSTFQIKSLNGEIVNFNRIGIVYNVELKESLNVVEKLEETFSKYMFPCIKKQAFSGKLKTFSYDKDIDIAVVVGGDGTVLGTARYYSQHNIPVFGINVGRLGFLTQLTPDNIEEGIKKLVNGEFKVEDRLMLKTFNVSKEAKFNYTALNDIVIRGGSVSRTAQLFLYINGNHVCDYLADGLIVSTPTGSTAYNISAGGPVVVPELDAIVISPICPHALTSRPIIIPANEDIMVKVNSDSDSIYLTADGQENVRINSSETIYIKQNDNKARLILLERDNNGFYGILREKLHWGVCPGC